jgi:hypothetical protein
MNETLSQITLSIVETLKAIVHKYNLPEDEVFNLASDIMKENMNYKKKTNGDKQSHIKTKR